MTVSIPRVMLSRDGSISHYIGRSVRGTLYGTATRKGARWSATCAGCGSTFEARLRHDVAYSLRDHWENADASMAATHVYAPATPIGEKP